MEKMKIERGILAITILIAIFCSVASAGNVNPATVSMEGKSVRGPGVGETGPIEGNLTGTVDSDQEFAFYTTSQWHVEVREANITENGTLIGSFSGKLTIEEGTTTGRNTVTRTNREILVAIANESGDDDFNPDNWTSKVYTVNITYWLYSDDKRGNTYITDIITFWWDGTYWRQSHHYIIWSDGETEIPEFSTIAIPAAAILGLVFLISRRSRHGRGNS